MSTHIQPPATNTPFLAVKNLCASFPGPKGVLAALDNVSFEVNRGEFICLIGPSGCGKSTLLRIIAGLLTPTSGEVRLEGDLQTKAGRRVGLVFQQPTLLPWRTVYDNIALPLELGQDPAECLERKTKDLLSLVGLSGFEEAFPAQLSGGMAQRAAIARALAQNPEMLLLDEPFGALDALTRERMAVELLRIWQRDKRTVLMVTHNVEEAALLGDRVIVLSPRPGYIVATVEVPIPRPRSRALLNAPELHNIAHRLRDALRET
ncbi:MAG: ABC transporter ATP-binding protein [Anaerolineae bacterium]|nr:ABC transporter ATP-binding protein [Anaerolineae bacterium]